MTYEEKKIKIGKIEKSLEISKNNEHKQKEKLRLFPTEIAKLKRTIDGKKIQLAQAEEDVILAAERTKKLIAELELVKNTVVESN